jgi:hypothetical protein
VTFFPLPEGVVQQTTKEEAIPYLSMVQLTKGFTGFVSKIGPLVSAWDGLYSICTLQNTQYSITVFAILSYSIIFFEHAIFVLSFAPFGLIAFIMSNMGSRKKFQRPPNTYVRNMKIIQALLNLISDLIEAIYGLIDDCIYWRNYTKTLLTLNALILIPLAIWMFILVLPVLPIRYILAVAVWTPAILNGDFSWFLLGQASSISSKYSSYFSKRLRNWDNRKKKLYRKIKKDSKTENKQNTISRPRPLSPVASFGIDSDIQLVTNPDPINFSVKQLILKLQRLSDQSADSKMSIVLYVDLYKEWMRFMSFFGNLIVIAFKDINDKAS